MHYDLTLKSLLQGRPRRLLKLLFGTEQARPLTVEYPQVGHRRPDLVLELDDGRLVHLEIQAEADPKMAARMLEYYGLILERFGRPAEQVVLYVGGGTLELEGRLDHPGLQFRYRVCDIRRIDCRALLASPELDEQLLALLCRMDEARPVVRRIVGRIAELPERARRDALVKLLILSGLRPLQEVVREEVARMPITLNLKDNPFYREAFEEGRQEGREEGREEGRKSGEAELLIRQLRLKFGPLPEGAVEHIRVAGAEELLAWGERVLTAETLDEVFGA